MKDFDKKYRLSLALFYSAVIFVNLFVALALVTAGMYILVQNGYIFVLEEHIPEGKSVVTFTAVISLIIGTVIAFVSSRFSLKPINKLISQMNRLASGDFKARLEYTSPIRKLPVATEITESFNKMAEELQSTELLRSDFINNFSHEFKTPIVSIAGFANLVRQGNLTEEEKDQYLATIEKESMRLAQMATNVLNLTRVENQTILTDKAKFNVSEQIRSCFLLLEAKWSRKNIDLDMEFDEYTIEANEDLLKQVWINLFDNAIKFTPDGGEIRTSIIRRGGDLRISITNTGSEISPENIKKIFNKFYQADESHSSEGNGIGLAIVKKVADLHGGSVTVESSNKTTTFTVTLPISA